MKEVIENLEKALQNEQEKLRVKLQETENIKANINKLVGALELAYSLKEQEEKPNLENDSDRDNEQPAGDK